MGNENNREYKTNNNKTTFQNQWPWTRIIDPEILFLLFCVCLYYRWFSLPIGSEILVVLFVLLYSRWFWLPIGSEILVVLFLCCIIDGVGYPLILESWCVLCCWYSLWCSLPIGSFWLTCACWKCCFAITKQHINLKTCIWLRRNACFEKWCFPPPVKQHIFWNWASRLGEIHFFII